MMFICKRMLFSRFVRLQRAGIAKCCLVEYAIPGLLPDGDALLDEIGVESKRRTSFMITDIEHLPSPRPSTDGAFANVVCDAVTVEAACGWIQCVSAGP